MGYDDIANRKTHLSNLNILKSAARSRHIRGFDVFPGSGLFGSLFGAKRKRANSIPYVLPGRTKIPRDFIRMDPWEIEYLYMLATNAKLGILEIGRFNGGSALVFAFANPDTAIHSIDIRPKDDEKLKNLLREFGYGNNVSLIVGDSQQTKYPQIGPIDLLFIDGDHSYLGCLNDLKNWWDSVTIGGHIVLHDTHFGLQSQAATIDFIEAHKVEVVVQPYKPHEHWRLPHGSLSHFIKRGA